MVALHPWPVRDGLDGLNSDTALLGDFQDGLEVLAVIRILHRRVVVGQQHRIEVEAIEAAPVRGGDLRAVAGHPDPLDQTFLAGSERRIESALRAQSLVPLDRIGE